MRFSVFKTRSRPSSQRLPRLDSERTSLTRALPFHVFTEFTQPISSFPLIPVLLVGSGCGAGRLAGCASSPFPPSTLGVGSSFGAGSLLVLSFPGLIPSFVPGASPVALPLGSDWPEAWRGEEVRVVSAGVVLFARVTARCSVERSILKAVWQRSLGSMGRMRRRREESLG